MSRITRNPRITAWIGSTCALALCTIWLLDANAEDRRKTIPDKKSARTRPANSNVRAGARAGAGTITVSGFRVKLMRQVLLGFDRVGTIADLDLHEGKRVKAGEVIAKLDDEVAVAALNSARKKASNDVHKRYATASYAVSKNEHQQALLANKNAGMDVVPKIEITRLFLAEQRSQLQIEQAVHDQAVADLDSALAEAQLNTYRLKAPFDGIVTRRFKQKGEAIRQGDPVIELVDVSTMKVEGRIPLEQAIRLRPGQKVVVQLVDSEDRAGVLPLAFKQARFPGRLVYIDPGVSLVGELDVRVWAEVANLQGLLRHGLTVQITIGSAVAP
jgi:RND family efflux transporter MFP subunit